MTAYLTTAALIATTILLAWACHDPLPTVYRLWPSGSCVEVRPSTAGTCLAPPRHYHTTWVAREYGA